MTLTHNTKITSYFKPNSEAKGKGTKTDKLNQTQDLAKALVCASQDLQTSMQPSSTSPTATASKRLNTDSNMDSDMDERKLDHLSYEDLPVGWLCESYTDLPEHWSNSPDPATPLNERRPTHLQLTYHTGDMFKDAPKNTLLIHACNTQGHWGAGIAKAFKDRYPKAYAAHHKFCAKEHDKTKPIPTGTAQLLAPVDSGAQHWIGCLFTSEKYGKAKDKPDMIVKNTGASMKMLLEFAKMSNVTEIRMCKINSGKFGVPWEKTEEELKEIVLRDGWQSTIEVWEP
jgi:ADP-ribose 1''-phosphate phosphatase